MLILMSICLLAEPGRCREERLSFSLSSNPIACVVHSQEIIANWQQSHPLWRVDRWRCLAHRAVPTNI